MTALTPEEQRLDDRWEEHVRDEFVTRDTEATLATMTSDAYVNHIPVMTGGVGREELREFYSRRFIPKMPPDTEIARVSRTIGREQIVDEMILRFTHTTEMDWMLPGVAPTGRRVEIPLVAIVRFREGKVAHEHIYWDQASVLVQLGIIDPSDLPVAGVDTARKAVDPSAPSNELIRRAERRGAGASEPRIPFTGGCACGAVRYECSAEPIMAVNCHCRDCQRATGSAYATGVFVPAAALRLTRGEPRYHEGTAESGNRVSRGFCADCGSPLIAKSSSRPMLIIHASSLDDPSWHRPTRNVWASRAQPWDHMDPLLPKYPKGLA